MENPLCTLAKEMGSADKSFSHHESKRGKVTQSSFLIPKPQTQHDGRERSPEKSPRGRGVSGKGFQKPVRNYLNENKTTRIRHVIAPRFCKLPRNCFLPAGKSINFFLSSHLKLWYSIVLEFPRGTVSWKVNSRILEKLLVAL